MPAPPRSALDDFLAAVRPAVDATLERLVPRSVPQRIHDAMRYSLFAGGKRVRPALLLMAGDLLGLERDLLLPGGAALEMIHTYSLIHDDLPALDNDDLRRGRPTLHREFDEATAILTGDSLLTLGLTVLASEPKQASSEARRCAVELVGQASGTLGMIGGQVDDLEAERCWPEDAKAALESIHQRKTGALLVVSLRLAGVYAGVPPELDQRLAALGAELGLLFQIADDILDVLGSSAEIGKTAGKDAARRKLTYPGLFGLAGAQAQLQAARERAQSLAALLPQEGGLFPALIDYLATRDR